MSRWQQSSELFDLIQSHPQVLKLYQPRLKFWLLDQGSFNAETLLQMQRVTAAIFYFEHTPDTQAAKQAIRALAQAIARSPYKQRLDRVVTRWVNFRPQSKMPGLTLPRAQELTKGLDMLETNVESALWRYPKCRCRPNRRWHAKSN